MSFANILNENKKVSVPEIQFRVGAVFSLGNQEDTTPTVCISGKSGLSRVNDPTYNPVVFDDIVPNKQDNILMGKSIQLADEEDRNVVVIGTNTTALGRSGSINLLNRNGGGLFVNAIREGDESDESFQNLIWDMDTKEIITSSSSQRFKDNIYPLADTTDTIKKLRPVSFRWKKNNSVDIGLIAEEVNETYPKLVSRNADGAISSVKYPLLPVLLLDVIQRLLERVDKLEKFVSLFSKSYELYDERGNEVSFP